MGFNTRSYTLVHGFCFFKLFPIVCIGLMSLSLPEDVGRRDSTYTAAYHYKSQSLGMNGSPIKHARAAIKGGHTVGLPKSVRGCACTQPNSIPRTYQLKPDMVAGM